MATKEDVLEQVAEEYLIHKGYFVRHNIKFLPRKDHPDFISSDDSNHSDIDILGFHPLKTGPEKVWAISCKSWQPGFSAESWVRKLSAKPPKKASRKKEAWKHFRELVQPKWSEAFRAMIQKETGQTKFTHVLAVTRLTKSSDPWKNHKGFKEALGGNPLDIITFSDMVEAIAGGTGTTLAATEIGRMIQLFKAAKYQLSTKAISIDSRR